VPLAFHRPSPRRTTITSNARSPVGSAEESELLALVQEGASAHVGSIAFLPSSVVGGLTHEAEDLMIHMSLLTGQPVITQGLGGRSKVDAPQEGPRLASFCARVQKDRAAIYSLLRVAPFDRPFTLARIQRTSNHDGVPSWRRMLALPLEEKIAALRDPQNRAELLWAVENPTTDPAQGSTLTPPPWDRVVVRQVRRVQNEGLVGSTIADIARATDKAPADVLLDLALSEDLETLFWWRAEDEGWAESVAEWQRHPNMLPGVLDGGAHLDREDGSGWSTYFLRTWGMERGLWSLEEAVRQITHKPAALCGLPEIGLITEGYRANFAIIDPDRLRLKGKRLFADFPGGAERFQDLPEGVVCTVVNGVVVARNGDLTGDLSGRVIRLKQDVETSARA
jgi:N-acyl-D-amino-acid deacylase